MPSVPPVLLQVGVHAYHLLGDGEDGGEAGGFALYLRTVAVGAGEAAEADEVLPAPALPGQLQQALVQQGLQRGGARGCPYPAAHLLQLGVAVAAGTHAGLALHQQHVGIAEEDNVVVHQLAVLQARGVHLVLLHAGAGGLFAFLAREVEGHEARPVDQGRAAVVQQDGVALQVGHLVGVIAEAEAGVLPIRAVAEDVEGVERGRGAVLASQAEGLGVVVVARTEEVDELVGVEGLAHGDDEDVLGRGLVEYGEVAAVVGLQAVSAPGDEVAVVADGLPGVHRLSVHVEADAAAVGAHAVCPVVVGVDFGVQGQLGQQEPGHGAGDAAVVDAGLVATLAAQGGQGLLELGDNEAEELAALHLEEVGGGVVRMPEQGHAAEEVHDVVIEQGSQGSHLGAEGLHVVGRAGGGVGVYLLQRTVAEHDGLVEVLPGVENGIVADAPAVEVEALPEAAVVPVGAAGGHDGLVGGEGVEVVDAAACALQALAVGIAADVGVERGYVVAVEVLQGSGGLVLADGVAGVLFQKAAARGEEQGKQQAGCKGEMGMVFHGGSPFFF